jgi:hypothetical protein
MWVDDVGLVPRTPSSVSQCWLGFCRNDVWVSMKRKGLYIIT